MTQKLYENLLKAFIKFYGALQHVLYRILRPNHFCHIQDKRKRAQNQIPRSV